MAANFRLPTFVQRSLLLLSGGVGTGHHLSPGAAKATCCLQPSNVCRLRPLDGMTQVFEGRESAARCSTFARRLAGSLASTCSRFLGMSFFLSCGSGCQRGQMSVETSVGEPHGPFVRTLIHMDARPYAKGFTGCIVVSAPARNLHLPEGPVQSRRRAARRAVGTESGCRFRQTPSGSPGSARSSDSPVRSARR